MANKLINFGFCLTQKKVRMWLSVHECGALHFRFLICMSMGVWPTWLSLHACVQCQWRPEEGVRDPEPSLQSKGKQLITGPMLLRPRIELYLEFYAVVLFINNFISPKKVRYAYKNGIGDL